MTITHLNEETLLEQLQLQVSFQELVQDATDPIAIKAMFEDAWEGLKKSMECGYLITDADVSASSTNSRVVRCRLHLATEPTLTILPCQ